MAAAAQAGGTRILNTGHPMYIWWGPELRCFYNDAYCRSIGPQIDQVTAGLGATWHENQLVPITRNGRREDVYWTYSYGPIDDEASPTRAKA